VGKPILCLDFDGVCHSYTSGWQGAGIISDPPVPGLFEFLEQAVQHFEIHIYSSRSHQENGIQAMMMWFIEHRRQWRENGGKGDEIIQLNFPDHKPSAMITIDDRAITFNGVWPDIEFLNNFKPWNKKATK
jgi:hypothetical protein